MKILILGAGLVGGPMAADLAAEKQFTVSIADINEDRLKQLASRYTLKTVKMDLQDPVAVTRLCAMFDMVINAVPGYFGFRTLEAVIRAGKNVVDIAFFIEDPFRLDALAKEKGVTAIMDCGVAPGMCNVLIGYANHLLDRTEKVVYYVRGLPVIRSWPWEYKAVFSPLDVIEEYTRPARFVENGMDVIRPALSDPELMDFPGIGTLEAFNTDGLRSLIHTIKAPFMKEKTLRYPGHIEKIRLLREAGFLDTDTINIHGSEIKPIDLTAKLLFPKWKLEEGEADITVMKVIVEGMKDTHRIRYTWDLYDRYDPLTGIHSMARTTGYTATVALRMIANGLYDHKGMAVPEYIGRKPECVAYMLKGLRERGVVYHGQVEEF